MKATIHTELRCGSCGQMMQYHQDVKVRCVQLKCGERNKEYLAPSVELYPVSSTLSQLEVAIVKTHADGGLDLTPGKVMSVDMEGRAAVEHLYKDEREMVDKSKGKKRGRPKTIKD